MLLPKFLRRVALPSGLSSALAPDETVLSIAELEGGRLAVTRYGIWFLPTDLEPTALHPPDAGDRIGWETVSKAYWDGSVLGLTLADVIGELGGAELIQDRPRRTFTVTEARKVTDIIHSRTRAGIVSSTHHELPGGGGWLVLRRIPGRDGLVPQLRLDPGTDVDTPGLAHMAEEYVAAALADHRPQV